MRNHHHSMIDCLNTREHFHQGNLFQSFVDRFYRIFHSLSISLSLVSYPYSEEHDEARSYLRVRCPAWCDRILLSHSLSHLVDTKVIETLINEERLLIVRSFFLFQTDPPDYHTIGEDVCMGDHKVKYR